MSESLLPWVHKVVVGSTNPVKLAAVRAVIARVAPQAEVVPVNVQSGVPDQPKGDDETRRGALERARNALNSASSESAELGIGIEGGVVIEADGSLRTCAWAVVVALDGRKGVGGSLAMMLPSAVAIRLQRGEELGAAMDAVSKQQNTKQRSGAVGILTAGLIDRQRAYEPLITYALAPFLAPSYFSDAAGG